MKARLLGIVLALSVAGVNGTNANFFDGNKIHRFCQESGTLFVRGYVTGLFDRSEDAYWAIVGLGAKMAPADREKYTASTNGAMNEIQGYCAPEKVTVRQLTDVFCKYLRDNPADRHEPASSLFSKAVGHAWPCKSSN